MSVRLQICNLDSCLAMQHRIAEWHCPLQPRISPCACEETQGPSVCPDRAACPCHTSSALQAQMQSGQLAGRHPAGSLKHGLGKRHSWLLHPCQTKVLSGMGVTWNTAQQLQGAKECRP